MVPRPSRLLARRRGGSLAIECTAPFFADVLEHLVGLDGAIRESLNRACGQGMSLQAMPPDQQGAVVTTQFVGQESGRQTLHDAAQKQDQDTAGVMRAAEQGIGKEIKNGMALTAAIADYGTAVLLMRRLLGRQGVSLRAVQPIGV